MIKTSNFEAVKIAIKQDKSGYVLTLNVHPDDISEEILRDFVGARYQVVMVRIDDQEQPFTRKVDPTVTKCAVLCRSPQFWDWLMELGEITERTEAQAAEAMHRMLGVNSRAELASNQKAREQFNVIMAEYESWKIQNNAPPF